MKTTETLTRHEAIKRIKTALQKRSGKTWSVTGGRGTAWGWLRIDASPKRCTWHRREVASRENTYPPVYEDYQTDGEHPGANAECGTRNAE